MGSLMEARRRILLSSPHLETIQNADIASFSTDMRSPLRSLRIGIDPVQDLHGYDAPWPAGGGKNLLDPSTASALGAVVWFCEPNGFLFKSGVSYTFSVSNIDDVESISIYTTDKTTQLAYSAGVSKQSVTYTPTEDTYGLPRLYRVTPITQAIVDGTMIEIGSVRTTFAPYSNICPISGWTEANLWRTGKNLLDVADYQIEASSAYNKSAGATLTFGGTGASVSGTNPIEIAVTTGWRGATFFSKPLKVGTTYYLRYRITATSVSDLRGTVYLIDDSSKVVDKLYNFAGFGNDPNYVFHHAVTTLHDNLRMAFVVESISSNQTIAIYDMGVMVGDWEVYTPYTGNQYTIQLGDTVYGGTFDVLSGVLTVDSRIINAGDVAWRKSGDVVFYAPPDLYTTVSADTPTGRKPLLCNTFSYYSGSSVRDGDIGYGGVNNNGNITIRSSVVASTLEDWNDYIANNTVQIVYPLATPLHYPLSDITISTLKGQNVVWGDSGKIELLKYWTHK